MNSLRLPGQGIDIAYRDEGCGPPVVLIMGLGAAADAWAPHLDCWSAEFRCIAVDNRGAGGSSAPAGPYSTALLADDCAELMSTLDIDSAAVVGISMGGAIAQELALRHPGLVRALVLVSSWARLDRHAVETFHNLATIRAEASPAAVAQLLQLLIWSPSYFAEHSVELAAERIATPMRQHAFAAQVRACVDHDTVDRLGAIAVPTLITAGERDIFTPPEYASQLTEIPDSHVETFAGGGHAHHWESLGQFNEVVAKWLR
jgi:pimeloyl-ACP methyl ester carboxylesterase